MRLILVSSSTVALGLLSYFIYVAWALTESAISGGWDPAKDLTRAQTFEYAAKAALGAGGIMAFLVAAWRGYSHDQQVRLAQRQRLDERFGEAVKLIGEQTLATRIGGLLALERLLHDEQFRPERWIIVQLLESYVRESCAQKNDADEVTLTETSVPQQASATLEHAPSVMGNIKEALPSNTDGKNPVQKAVSEGSKITQDGQVAMSILGRRPTGDEPRRLDFSGLFLRGVRLNGGHFANATFHHSQLGGADFSDADLDHVVFAKAELNSAKFENAKLRDADFWLAKLESCNFNEASLSNADFGNAQIGRTSFILAELDGASFYSARANGTDFWGAHGTGTDFSHAELQRAEFVNSTFEDTEFVEANLEDAEFSGATLQNPNFENARLKGSEFGKSVVDGERWLAARLKNARGLTYAQVCEAASFPRSLLKELKKADKKADKKAGHQVSAE